MKVLANTRFYRYIDNSDDIIELRVIGFSNNETCKCKITKGPESDIGKQIKIPISELKDKYTELIPDGVIIFSTVRVQQGLDDVMVTVSTREDMDIGLQMPSVVCRQCVLDLFAKQMTPDKDYVGLSISKETCPADIEFENFLACESVLSSTVCNYYIGDTLEYLLTEIVNTKKFDNVLSGLLYNHCEYTRKFNPGAADYFLRKGEADGYINNLEGLLTLNNFEYDLYRAFHIIPTTLTADNFEDGVLTKYAEKVLSDILRTNIYKSLVVKYDKDIDLKNINKKYVLVSDNDGTVYVVAYFTNGSYQVDENGEMLESDEQISNAYSSIKFNNSKYNYIL